MLAAADGVLHAHDGGTAPTLAAGAAEPTETRAQPAAEPDTRQQLAELQKAMERLSKAQAGSTPAPRPQQYGAANTTKLHPPRACTARGLTGSWNERQERRGCRVCKCMCLNGKTAMLETSALALHQFSKSSMGAPTLP